MKRLALFFAACSAAFALPNPTWTVPGSVQAYSVMEATASYGAYSACYANSSNNGATITATFTDPATPTPHSWTVSGFCKAKGTSPRSWAIRFMPGAFNISTPVVLGTWSYSIVFTDGTGASTPATGTFSVTSAAAANKGPIYIDSTYTTKLRTLADNNVFYPIGSTIVLVGQSTGNPNYPALYWCVDQSCTGTNSTTSGYFNLFSGAGFNAFRVWADGSAYASGSSVYQSGTLNSPGGSGQNSFVDLNLTQLDSYFAVVQPLGMHTIFELSTRPCNFWPGGATMANDGGANWQSWSNYVAYLVARYSAYVDVWEIGNENTVSNTACGSSVMPVAFLTSTSTFIKSIDPYQHPVASDWANQTSNVTGIDVTLQHLYETAPTVSASNGMDCVLTVQITGVISSNCPSATAGRGAFSTHPGKPQLIDEGGNSCTTCSTTPCSNVPTATGFLSGDAADGTGSGTGERYREELMTAFFSNVYWWGQYQQNNLNNCSSNGNMYLGPGERASALGLSNNFKTFDIAAVAITPTVSSNIHAYVQGSNTDIGGYIRNKNQITSPTSGETITINWPGAMTITWISPIDGSTITTSSVSAGTNAVTVPTFTEDILFRAQTSGGGTPVVTATMTAPSNGAVVSGSSVTLTATASVTSGSISYVQFKLNGANLGGHISGSSPYSYTWDTTSTANGTGYNISAIATDGVGNTGSAAPVTVTVNNGPSYPQADSITYTDLSGATTGAYPRTVFRFFKQGDIPHYAQPRVNGVVPFSWQNDVTNRWGDGSLKAAYVTFFLPSFSANGSVTVDFIDNVNACHLGGLSTCQNAALTPAAMLSHAGDPGAPGWNAQLSVSFSGLSSPIVTDAKTMLTAAGSTCGTVVGAQICTYILQGPVVTRVLLEDRSTALTYDFGATCSTGCTGARTSASYVAAASSAYNSLHPMFVLDFYPDYDPVKTEWILENVWDTRVQDLNYTLSYLTGGTPAVVYGPINVTQPGMTRWHHSGLWNNTSPSAIKTDLNQAYLESSKAIPNYDPSVTVTTGGGVTTQLNEWNASDQGGDQYGAPFNLSAATTGLMYKDLSSTGAHEWIGYYPTWTARYLYTFYQLSGGDDLLGAMLGQGNVSGYMPLHLAMTDNSKTFCGSSATCTADGNNTVSAFGRVQTRDAYPLNAVNAGSGASISATASNSAPVFTVSSGGTLYTNPTVSVSGGTCTGLTTSVRVVLGVITGVATLTGTCVSNPTSVTVSNGAPGGVDSAYAPTDIGTTATGLCCFNPTWNLSLEHWPSLVDVPYLATGDYFYLTEQGYIASWLLMKATNGTTADFEADGSVGYLPRTGLSRSLAWRTRELANAADRYPDGTPEKDYFLQKLRNNAAIRAGVLGLNPSWGHTNDLTDWNWGHTVACCLSGATATNNPLALGSYTISSDVTSPATATATITSGHVSSLAITVNGGSGNYYTAQLPTVTIGGDGSGASYNAVLSTANNPTTGQPCQYSGSCGVASFSQVSSGNSYTTAPVTIGLPPPWSELAYGVTSGGTIDGAEALWCLHYYDIVLGRLVEMGYTEWSEVQAAQAGLSNVIVGSTSIGNPWLIGTYRIPTLITTPTAHAWIQTYADLFSGWQPPVQGITTWNHSATDATGGYNFIALGAASFYGGINTSETGCPSGTCLGSSTYNWIKSNVTYSTLNENPMWAFAPRAPASGIPPTVTTSSLPNGTVGVAYSQALAATGDTGGTCSGCTWTVTSGSLPTGLSLSSGGTISGTISGSSGTFSFTVTATNSAGNGSLPLSILANPAVTNPTKFSGNMSATGAATVQ